MYAQKIQDSIFINAAKFPHLFFLDWIPLAFDFEISHLRGYEQDFWSWLEA